MLVSTTSNGVSNTFKVYAADNCDASSPCVNTPGSSIQRNECNRVSTCSNLSVGNLNTQNNNCNGASDCFNLALGNSNTKNNNCNRASSCATTAEGSSTTQNVVCANESGCATIAFSGTQNTACQSSECTNIGSITNVISNSATTPCTAGGTDTTTFCQQGRTPIIFPNH
jgi:hypothetical protein